MKKMDKYIKNNLNIIICSALKDFILKKKNSVLFEYLENREWDLYSLVIIRLNCLFIPRAETIYLKLNQQDLYLTRRKKHYIQLIKDMKKIKKEKSSISKKETYLKIIEMRGKFLEIPKCCRKKYMEDQEKNFNGGHMPKDYVLFKQRKEGINSLKRYKRQLRREKIKCPFGISLSIKKEVCFTNISFIPCHPKCPKAQKILKEYSKGGILDDN